MLLVLLSYRVWNQNVSLLECRIYQVYIFQEAEAIHKIFASRDTIQVFLIIKTLVRYLK